MLYLLLLLLEEEEEEERLHRHHQQLLKKESLSFTFASCCHAEHNWSALIGGDPLLWSSNDVMAWLWHIFRHDRLTDIRDLNFYLMYYVAQWEEHLNGHAMSQLTYTDYQERWGFSGHAVFEDFLLVLQQAGHAGR